MKEKNNIKMVNYPNNDLYQSRKICAFQKVLKTTTSTLRRNHKSILNI